MNKIVSLHTEKWSYPPKPYLQQACSHCPTAVSTYITLWDSKNHNNVIVVPQQEICEFFMEKKQKIVNDLMKLCKEGLLSVSTSPNFLTIELVGWDYEGQI